MEPTGSTASDAPPHFPRFPGVVGPAGIADVIRIEVDEDYFQQRGTNRPASRGGASPPAGAIDRVIAAPQAATDHQGGRTPVGLCQSLPIVDVFADEGVPPEQFVPQQAEQADGCGEDGRRSHGVPRDRGHRRSIRDERRIRAILRRDVVSAADRRRIERRGWSARDLEDRAGHAAGRFVRLRRFREYFRQIQEEGERRRGGGGGGGGGGGEARYRVYRDGR